MLSTRLGCGRPAFLAERLARTFCAGESLREPPFFVFLRFGVRHGAFLAANFFLVLVLRYELKIIDRIGI